MESLESQLKAKARELGFGLVGITDAAPPLSYEAYRQWVADGHHGTMSYMARSHELRADLNTLLPGVQSVVAVGAFYRQPEELPADHPKIARYALGRDYHKVLRGRLRTLDRWLHAEEGQGRICVDSAPVLEREYAHRAGLGWYGKNTMLINTYAGSWFVIGLLLSTRQLAPDAPAQGGCGTCRACIDACPTGAIVHQNGRWQVDARDCISYLTIEHRGEIESDREAKLDDWVFGCDVCQEVCPFNTVRPSQPGRAPVLTMEDFRARTWPPVEELAHLTPEAWDTLTAGSPVRRAGYDGLRRHARRVLRTRV